MKLIVKVPDMTCDHCKMTINSAVRGVEKVEDVDIDLNKKTVEVTGHSDVQTVIAAIKNSGYTVEKILNIQPN